MNNVIRYLAVSLSALAFAFVTESSLARVWTSKSGKFKTDAELVEATDSEVRLRKPNGTELTVAISKLSKGDVAYLKSLKKPAAAKLVPLKFKVLDDELTIDVPAGAKVDPDAVFPTIRQGKKFIMTIQPTSDNDVPDFKEQFTKQSEFTELKKTLLEEENAFAYKVLMKAFKQEVSVYMVIVDVDGKKFTCSDTSMEEMNRREKLTPEDIGLVVQCAKTLKSAK